MKKFAKYFLLSSILLLAVGLNFYRLNNIPNGFYVDEVVSGYNAYSLLETGKDEYGKSWPLALRFLGSYSPPLYTYLTMIPVGVFGLEIWAVRLVSAVSGVLGVWVVWWFLRTIAKAYGHSQGLPYIGGLVMAVSPWNILFSRAGYEIYLGALLFWVGAWFLWKGLNDKRWFICGWPILSISTYGAHAERYLVFLFSWLFVLIFFRKLKFTKEWWIGVLIAGIIQIPNMYLIFTPAWWGKNELFYWQAAVEMGNKYYSWAPEILANILGLLRKFGSQYLTYFSPRSLFWLGDADPQRSMPELAVFYWWMVLPYVVGGYRLWKGRKMLWAKYVWLLLLTTPLPAALTNDPFSSQRALPMLLPMVVVISLGLNYLGLKSRKYLLFYCFTGLLFLYSFLVLWRSYFVLLPVERAEDWNHGYSALVHELMSRPSKHFVIDQSRQPPMYIGLAFFMKLDPHLLQNSRDDSIRFDYYNLVKFSSQLALENIELRSVNWERDLYIEQILVGDSLAISDNQAAEHFLDLKFVVSGPQDRVLFRGWQTNPKEKCRRSVVKSELCRYTTLLK